MSSRHYGADGRPAEREPTERLPVFVYGSLRMGGTLNRHIAAFVERAEPDKAVGVERNTRAWFRGVTFGGGAGELIDGELLYLQDAGYDRIIGAMDMMENTPDLFERVAITTDSGVRAWAYSYVERLWDRRG